MKNNFIVEELLRWKKQSDHYNPSDVTFHEKAVKALVRKLKRGKEKGGSQVRSSPTRKSPGLVLGSLIFME